MSGSILQPWDHDLSWNWESEVQLTELPRRPIMDLFLCCCLVPNNLLVIFGSGPTESLTDNHTKCANTQFLLPSRSEGRKMIVFESSHIRQILIRKHNKCQNLSRSWRYSSWHLLLSVMKKNNRWRNGSAIFQPGVMVWIALLIELSGKVFLKRWHFIKDLNMYERSGNSKFKALRLKGA